MNKNFVVLLLTQLSLLTGCYSIDCPIENVVSCSYGFYSQREGEIEQVNFEDTLTVRAFGTDSVLINRLYNRNQMKLPVSYYRQIDTLIFQYDSPLGRAYDTLWVEKQNYPHFENPNCPTSMFHTLISVKSSHIFIDTVLVVNSEINYDTSENIQILFH